MRAISLIKIKLAEDFFNKLCSDIDKQYFPTVKYYRDNKDCADVHYTVELFNNGCLAYNDLISRLAKSCKETEKNIIGIANKYIEFVPATLKGGNPIPALIEYHRKPTESEIKFGHGATHYLSFSKEQFLKKDGTIKKRLKCSITGLIYTR